MSKQITLYHAKWCGHCTTFMPVWNDLKSTLKENNISYKSYEDGANKAEIEKAGVNGFPTVRITVDGKTSDYDGPRNKRSILQAIGIASSKEVQYGTQSGGGGTTDYYHKYMKYKAKYVKLQEQFGK